MLLLGEHFLFPQTEQAVSQMNAPVSRSLSARPGEKIVSLTCSLRLPQHEDACLFHSVWNAVTRAEGHGQSADCLTTSHRHGRISGIRDTKSYCPNSELDTPYMISLTAEESADQVTVYSDSVSFHAPSISSSIYWALLADSSRHLAPEIVDHPPTVHLLLA